MERSNLALLKRITAVLCFTFIYTYAFCQSAIKPQVLTKVQWKDYFARNYNLKNSDTLTIDVPKTDIPYPKKWWYAADKNKALKDKYALYKVSADADFVTMPSNNGIGTYIFYFNHKNPSENWVEMNFVADSIKLKMLTPGIFMFQLNDDGFKIPGDSSGLKRYIFVGADGRICDKSVVAHGCYFTKGSVDTLHTTVYFDISYSNRPGFPKSFRLDYRIYRLLTSLDDVEDLNGNIILDSIHYCLIRKVGQ